MYINLGISIRYHGTLMKVDHGYNDILECLRPYGLVSLFGSARVGKEFINNHDIDIGIVTELKSKTFLIEKCTEAIKKYEQTYLKVPRLPLHFIIISNLSSDFIFIKAKGKNHMIQFTHKKWRYMSWGMIIIKKWIESLLKRS